MQPQVFTIQQTAEYLTLPQSQRFMNWYEQKNFQPLSWTNPSVSFVLNLHGKRNN